MVDIALDSTLEGGAAATALSARPVVNATVTPVLAFGTLTDAKSTVGLTAPVDFTGSGRIKFIGLHNSSGSNMTASELKITIDGTVVYDETGAIATAFAKQAVGWIYSTSAIMAGGFEDEPFYESLKIEYAADGTNSLNCNWMYTTT